MSNISVAVISSYVEVDGKWNRVHTLIPFYDPVNKYKLNKKFH